MRNDTWTDAPARLAVRPLIGSGVTPNHLITLRLLTRLAGCAFLALGPESFLWCVALGWWIMDAVRVPRPCRRRVCACGDMMSPDDHRYDHLVDNRVNCLFFLAIGVGLRHASLFGHDLALWTIALGALSGGALLLCNWMSEIHEAGLPNDGRICADALPRTVPAATP